MTDKTDSASPNPKLDKYLMKLLDDCMKAKDDAEVTLLDKLKIIDRVLKWEAIKLKADSEDFGKDLFNTEEEENGKPAN